MGAAEVIYRFMLLLDHFTFTSCWAEFQNFSAIPFSLEKQQTVQQISTVAQDIDKY